MIPANIDHAVLIAGLNEAGLKDYKIELICGFSFGYVAHVKSGKIAQMTYQRAARLHNFWCSERGFPGLMIPANVDHVAIIEELNRRGVRDYVIESMCGFSKGYVSHIKMRNIEQMTYQRAARLHNLLMGDVFALSVPRGTESNQCLAETST